MASAAILAGGRSRRFGGRDKAALRIGDRSILERQLRELTEVADEVLLVGGRTKPPSGGHTPAWGQLRAIADRYPDCGPLGGLDAALAAATHDALVVVACDMPFVTAPLLAYLLQFAAEAQAVVPRTERGCHPLCAVYDRSCRPVVAERIARRQLSMVGLLETLRVRTVERVELERFGSVDWLLANVNTPADLQAIEAHLGQKV